MSITATKVRTPADASLARREHVRFHVIASDAKQSTYPLAALWIASSQALLAMTAVGDVPAVARRTKAD
jgi:hypothetical protein